MENENKSKEQIGPYKNSKDIVITQNQVKKIAVAILALICIFTVVMYLNSGLTHRKAKQVFIEHWNNTFNYHNIRLDGVKILGIKKIKNDIYWVKISYSHLDKAIDWDELLLKEEIEKETQEQKEYRKSVFEKNNPPKFYKENKDYVYTKWDTGWFIEEKKK